MDNLAIKFKNVSKKFYLQQEKTFKEFLPQIFLGKSWAKEFNALTDVSFEIKIGETVGIVGKNGAGKSTMLKLIAGVTKPSSGEVKVFQKVAPLIEVGAGFHHELSGYENIFLNAAILGLHKKEIKQRIGSIIEFSEISNDFIHTPIKRYSSGMYLRLGFAVAIHADAPIILIDEILSVGDSKFQKKCIDYLQGVKKQHDKTIVFVSHDEKSVKSFCDRVILLQNGKVIADGTSEDIYKKYHQLQNGDRK